MTNPTFIPIRFSNDGSKNDIYKTLQQGQYDGALTWSVGVPPISMIEREDGGLAPDGRDFNGLFYVLSDHAVHRQNGGSVKWSQDVVSEYGGYSTGYIVQSDDNSRHYISLVNNNTINPNVSLSQNWSVYMGAGSIPVATSTTSGTTKVINSLNSTDSGSALSAAQGKALQDSKINFTDIVNDLTTIANNKPLSATQGKVLNDIFSLFSGDLSQNGGCVIRLGNSGKNVILKWGLVSDVIYQEERVVVFPEAFPNSCLNLQITSFATGFTTTYENIVALKSTPSRTQFTVRNMWAGDDSGTFRVASAYWFAIGY